MEFDGLELVFDKVREMFGKKDVIEERFVQYIHMSMGETHCNDCLVYQYRIYEKNGEKPPVGIEKHFGCHCKYNVVKQQPAGLISKMGLNAPDVWLKAYGVLPDYYITKEVAQEEYGWDRRRNKLSSKAPGKMIGGDVFQNKEHKLPEATGRIWYECDVDYEKGSRSSERLFYSNDGLMFYSRDHGISDFIYIY